MKKIIFSIVFFLVLNFSFLYSQNGWFAQYIPNSSDQLLNLQFFNLNTGYVTGSNCIYKTTNGGENWINISSTAGSGYYALHFLNPNTGYVGGYFNSYTGRILKTTNGGENWIVQQTGIYDVMVRAVYAFDENTVIIGENFSGTNGQIFKSTNGGQNWVRVFFNAYKGIECIKFINSLTGFACGRGFWKTTDAGNSWTEKTLPYQKHQYSISFINENTGYIVGVNSIAKTTNSGDNWTVQSQNINNYLMSVSFINENTGMVVGENGTILRTTNGGEFWQDISRPIYDYIGGVQMLNSDTVICSGWVIDSTNRSLVLKSYTGGLTTINNFISEIPTSLSLGQNYPNPFNPSTMIKFDIASSPLIPLQRGNLVKIVVYDVMGREVQTLVNERLQAGSYEVMFYGSGLTSGVYFYRMVAEGFSETRRMVLLK